MGCFYPQRPRQRAGLMTPEERSWLKAGNQAWEPNRTFPPVSALELHPGKTLQRISRKASVNRAFVWRTLSSGQSSLS